MLLLSCIKDQEEEDPQLCGQPKLMFVFLSDLSFNTTTNGSSVVSGL